MDIQYVECAWSNEKPDACPFCSGEKCNKCGAGMHGANSEPCEHDSLDRHED